jgi:DNA-binding NarL/FixJ family response regulator
VTRAASGAAPKTAERAANNPIMLMTNQRSGATKSGLAAPAKSLRLVHPVPVDPDEPSESITRQATRVVLCDDHEIVRDAIKSRMADSNLVEIVGEATNGLEVIDVVRDLTPDVLIIDVEMPGRDGIDATKDVVRLCPQTRVIIFTAHAQPDLVAMALRAGASGYVLKSAAAEDITTAVEAVADGGTFLGSDLAGGAEAEIEKLLDLSPLKCEILDLLAEGLRVNEVAERLSLSPATVHAHVGEAIAALEVDSRTEAVALTVRFSYLAGGALKTPAPARQARA